MSRSSISQPCSLALLERAHILLLPSEPYMANCQEYSYIISNQSCDVAIPEHSKSAQLRKVKQNSQDVPSLRVLRPKSREEHDEMFWSKATRLVQDEATPTSREGYPRPQAEDCSRGPC